MSTDPADAAHAHIPQPQGLAISPATRSALVATGNNATLEVVNIPAAGLETSIPNGRRMALEGMLSGAEHHGT